MTLLAATSLTLTLGRASDEARRWNREVVDTQEMLIALRKDSGDVLRPVLDKLGITLPKVLVALEMTVPAGADFICSELPVAAPLRRLLEEAERWAVKLRYKYLEAAHVWLAITTQPACAAARTLANLQVNLEELQNEILKIPGLAPAPRLSRKALAALEKVRALLNVETLNEAPAAMLAYLQQHRP